MSRRIGLPGALLAPLAAALAVTAVLAGPVADVSPADAQAQNRAAVIVDTGGGTAAVCVRFSEPAITGLDALQRAGLGAVVRSFSGQGAAVCGLNGVGCPADDSCLTCQAPNYWAYHRAGPGSGGFGYSSSGAASTQVTDGSVEGWRWGTGGAPSFSSVDQVCGAAEVPPPAAAPDAGSPVAGGAGTTGGAPPAPATDTGGAADPGTSTSGSVTTTTIEVATTGGSADADGPASPGDDDDGLDRDLAASSRTDDGDDGSPWAVGLFVLLVVGIGTAAVVIRRRRSV